MPTLGWSRTRRLAYLALFAVAIGVAAFLVLPVRTGQVGYDSAASVLYFERLISGRHLEAFISATPKPVLTLVYGLAYEVLPDWRVISWLTIVAFAFSVVLVTALADRVGGPSAAGFAAAGFVLSATLLRDVALAYALVWALLGWLIAGTALTATPPRYGLAGLGLLIAASARMESLLLSVLAVAAVAAWWGLARSGRLAPPPRAAWLLGIGLLAVPIQLGHDWLLTGDLLYSQKIAPLVTAEADVIGPVARTVWLIERYLDYGLALALALLGVAWLAIERRVVILLGLAGLGLGVAAFLVLLEARHIYVSTRYAGAIDLAVLFTAAFGTALLARAVMPSVRERIGDRREHTALVVAGGILGVLVAAQIAAPSPDVVGVARSDLTLHANADAARPSIEAELDRIADVRDVPDDRPSAALEPAADPSLFVPTLLRPQLALDLGLPLTAIARTDVASLRPGQVVFHDRRGDGPDPAFEIFEVDTPTVVGDLKLVPVASNPTRGWWLVRVEDAGA